MTNTPKPYEIYKHFKGKLYQVLAIAKHSETEENMVVYQALYGDYQIYVRELSMFMSPVDNVKYPNVTQKMRFELQNTQNDTEAQNDKNEQVAFKVQEEVQNSSEEEMQLDPLVIEFLDAENYEERLNILAGLKHRITDAMITTMAISCDVEVPEGAVEERYESLRNCLVTRSKFEGIRLR